jgi:hypothetical protein
MEPDLAKRRNEKLKPFSLATKNQLTDGLNYLSSP